MPAGSYRRRQFSAGSATVKVAFGQDDQDPSDNDENEKSPQPNEQIEKKAKKTRKKRNGHSDPSPTYHRAFFTINNTTVEVELKNDTLSWCNISANLGNVDNETYLKEHGESIDLKDVYAISPIHTGTLWQMNSPVNLPGSLVSTSNSLLDTSTTIIDPKLLTGFQLHSYQKSINNMLQEILIIFRSNSHVLIEEWYYLLYDRLSRLRPSQKLLIICNPYAGSRNTRYIYRTKIQIMLERARYHLKYAEIDDNYSVDQILDNLDEDFDSFDGLVIVGGDGTVINVINGLIRFIARENRLRLDMENDLPIFPFPICIIPDGTTNMICHSYQGNTDHITAALNLLFDRRMKIDMSAIFDAEYNFVTANFNAGAGYPANAMKYFSRFCLHNPKTIIKKSFYKAASKKNLKPVRASIRFIPADESTPSFTPCLQGCTICTPDLTELSDNQVKAFDQSHIMKIQKRPSATNLNGTLPRPSTAKRQNSQRTDDEKHWETYDEELLHVLVLTNAALWSFAPMGLSKNGHLANGLLDLIVVTPIGRKEFLRYLRRNGNSKSPFDLEFVKLIRVKEIEIEIHTMDSLTSESKADESQLDSSAEDSSSDENLSDEKNQPNNDGQKTPHPPSAPMPGVARPYRRHILNDSIQKPTESNTEPTQSSSKSRQKQSDETGGSLYGDPLGSNSSIRRSSFFQSIRERAGKLHLPRPFTPKNKDTDDEKEQKKDLKKSTASMRPARSLFNLRPSSRNSFSSNGDSLLNSASRNASLANRRPSIISRSSSFDNEKIETMKQNYRRKKQPCLWNLDFSPYNTSLIRIKCFNRYLPVFGVGLDANVKIKEVNYSCF